MAALIAPRPAAIGYRPSMSNALRLLLPALLLLQWLVAQAGEATRAPTQWASLNLARLQLAFCQREQAVAAIQEAVRSAQQQEDNVRAHPHAHAHAAAAAHAAQRGATRGA